MARLNGDEAGILQTKGREAGEAAQSYSGVDPEGSSSQLNYFFKKEIIINKQINVFYNKINGISKSQLTEELGPHPAKSVLYT